MQNLKAHKDIVDLRGIQTNEQKRVDRLRTQARALWNDSHTTVQNDDAQNSTTRSHTWNDVVSGVFRVASIALVVAGSWSYLPSIAASLAYFTDTEASASHLGSGSLDLTASTSVEVIGLMCGGMSDHIVTLATDADGFDASIRATTTALSGDLSLCNAIELDVRHHSETVFSGQLYDFAATDLTDGDLRFITSVSEHAGPFDDGAQCTMTIGFEAWLASAADISESGYTDYEEINLTYAIDADSCHSCDEPCNTCGDLYVDIVNENDSTIINTFGGSASTGGNDASGGGTIETGTATSGVFIINESNISSTTVEASCSCTQCGCGEEPAASEEGESGEEQPEVSSGESPEELQTEEIVEVETEEESEPGEDEEPEEIVEETETVPTPDEIAAQIQAQLDEQLSGMFGTEPVVVQE